jgi:hypothetical protein
MTTTIDQPGLAKVPHPGEEVLQQLENEKARVRRRLHKAKAKLAGLQALKEDLLRRYMQPEDYKYEEERLRLEVQRWSQEHFELHKRFREQRHRMRMEHVPLSPRWV